MNCPPIRVLFLQSHLGVGGAARQVADLVALLDRSRFEPIVCCVREPGEYGGELQAAGFKVYSNLLSFEWDIRVIYKISEIICRERVDVLFNSGTNRTFLIGYLAALIAGLKKIIVSIHSTTRPNGGNLTGPVTRWVLRRVSRVVMVCDAQKGTVCARERISADKVTVIHNGVSLTRLNFADPLTPAQAGIPIDRPRVVGIVARLVPEKDHRVFLGAARLICGMRPDVFFLVIGDGQERSGLERLAQEWGIADRIRFLGNLNPVTRVLPLLDVGVLSSRIESFPICIQELMAFRKPVVVTDVGGLREMIDDGVEGFIVRPCDAGSLAQRILILLEDKDRATLMGARGRQRVERDWTAERMAREFEHLFFEVCLPQANRRILAQDVRTGVS